MKYVITNEEAMEALAASMSQAWSRGIVYLIGDLGAGKTTFVRGFLRAKGYQDVVKSPTFSLVESYDVLDYCIHHFDLYRLNSPLELEGMGFRDYLGPNTLCFIEWPQKGEGVCPAADIEVSIKIMPGSREVSVSYVGVVP